jgi:hypothetical protein
VCARLSDYFNFERAAERRADSGLVRSYLFCPYPNAEDFDMALDGHIRELEAKHRKLDDMIAQESRKPATNATDLREFKKQKLRIKEELERLRGSVH